MKFAFDSFSPCTLLVRRSGSGLIDVDARSVRLGRFGLSVAAGPSGLVAIPLVPGFSLTSPIGWDWWKGTELEFSGEVESVGLYGEIFGERPLPPGMVKL